MNIHKTLLILACLSICGCSDSPKESATPGMEQFMEQLNSEAKNGILGEFADSISRGEYEHALTLFHPKLSEAWTKERFAKDWQGISSQLSSGLALEPMGSFAGNSAQGPYKQATYRLEKSWSSTTSLELTSLQVEGQSRIVKVDIRMPRLEELPPNAAALADSFAESMLKKDFNAVLGLFSESSASQYNPKVLEKLGAMLGDSKASTTRSFYRLCANSVWYDVVLLQPQGDPAQHLELITQSTDTKTEILSITFKGRM